MAQDIKMKITVDTKTAENNVEDLNKDLKETGQMATKAGQAAEKSKSGWSKMGGAIKGVGMAFKAAGIGIIIGLLAKLFEMLKGNQAVMDFFNKASYTLSILFNQIAEAVKPLGKLITDAFNNPKDAVLALWEAIKTNLLNRVTGIVDVFKALGKTIQAAISLDWDEVKANAADLGESLTQVVTGIDDLPNKIKEGIGSIADTFKDATAAADEYIERQNQLKLNEAELNKFIAMNKEEINALKIVRDDENQSMEERIKATEKINELIGEETERSIALQQEKINLMKADLENTQTTVDDIAAITNAEAQLANLRANASTRERENLLKVNSIRKQVAAQEAASAKEAQVIAEAKAKIQEEEVAAELLKLETFLQQKSDLEAQWRLDDAETAQEFYDELRDQENEKYEAELENINITNEEKELLEEQHLRNMIDINKKAAKTQEEIDDEITANKMATFDAISNLSAVAASLFKEDTAAHKLFASTSVIIDTAMGIVKAMALNPLPSPIGVLSSVAIGLAGTASLAKIAGVQFARGGVLNGPSHMQGGILTPFGELEGNEGVINKTSMANPSLRNLASIANEAGGGVGFGTGDGSITLSDASIAKIIQGYNDKQVYVTETDITESQERVSVIESDSYL